MMTDQEFETLVADEKSAWDAAQAAYKPLIERWLELNAVKQKEERLRLALKELAEAEAT